jgi:glyceraldehyde 3-phosphate dehydrogenase
MTVAIAINGFGRIGRTFFRLARDRADFAVLAINDVANAATLAHLLKYDSIHGRYPGEVHANGDGLWVDGRRMTTRGEPHPRRLDWRALGVWGVLESTGRCCQPDDLAAHLAGGARKVVLSANPASTDGPPIRTCVFGVNEDDYDPARDHLLSNASCTTNALAPLVKALDETFGVEAVTFSTVHAYTHDQNLVDGPHADWCRARAAGLNIVPTTTGAAEELMRVLPHLAGRIRGLSLRVPTPNVSLIDLNVVLRKTTSAEGVVNLMRSHAAGRLHAILEIVDEPVVSSDLNGVRASAVLDAPRTCVLPLPGGGALAKLIVWHDNETAYAARLVDLFAFIIQREKERSDGHQVLG